MSTNDTSLPAVRVPATQRDQLRDRAQAEGRTLSGLVRHILTEYLSRS